MKSCFGKTKGFAAPGFIRLYNGDQENEAPAVVVDEFSRSVSILHISVSLKPSNKSGPIFILKSLLTVSIQPLLFVATSVIVFVPVSA